MNTPKSPAQTSDASTSAVSFTNGAAPGDSDEAATTVESDDTTETAGTTDALADIKISASRSGTVKDEDSIAAGIADMAEDDKRAEPPETTDADPSESGTPTAETPDAEDAKAKATADTKVGSGGMSAPETATTDPTAAPAPTEPRNRATAHPLMLVLAAVLGGILAILLTEGLRSNRVPAAVDARIQSLGERIEAVELASGNPETLASVRDEMAGLRSRLTELESLRRDVDRLSAIRTPSGTTGRVSGSAVAALEGSISELNDATRQIETRLSQLSGEVTRGQTRLQDRVAALEGLTPRDLGAQLAGKASVATVDSLNDRVGDLERNDVARDARRAALAVALANLTRAVQDPGPFGAELQAIDILMNGDGSLEGLRPYAEEGLPDLDGLRASFTGVSRRVMRAWRTTEYSGVLGRLWANLLASVTVRPVGEATGDNPPAVVARAERRLGEGDLRSAIDEVAALKGDAAEAAAPWLADARARRDLDALIRHHTTTVIAAIARQTTPPSNAQP